MNSKTISDFKLKALAREHARVLVVDDHPDLLRLIKLRLRQFNFDLRTAVSAEEALTILSVWPADLVVTDLQLPGMSGMELFTQIQHDNPLLPVIILTAHGTIEDAVAATQAGVVTYLSKPFDSDVLVQEIQNALLNVGFTEEQSVSSDEVYYDRSWQGKIVTASPLMKALLAQVIKLAETDVLVTLEGENGTGKSEIAKALHRRSARCDGPLIEIGGSAYPEEVLAAEIFGVEEDLKQGISKRKGKLQSAEGGFLLIRDVDEAPADLLRQVLLAFAEGSASPINSTTTYNFNVRLLTTSSTPRVREAPHEELWDSAYKLGLTALYVPPLRDRREDISLIANHYLQKFRKDKETQFSGAALKLLTAAEWPGNIRQLIAVVRQCVQLTGTNIISEALVSSKIDAPLFSFVPLSAAQREFERGYVTDVLKATSGNVTKAAALAKRNRTEFHRLMRKHQIEAKEFRGD